MQTIYHFNINEIAIIIDKRFGLKNSFFEGIEPDAEARKQPSRIQIEITIYEKSVISHFKRGHYTKPFSGGHNNDYFLKTYEKFKSEITDFTCINTEMGLITYSFSLKGVNYFKSTYDTNHPLFQKNAIDRYLVEAAIALRAYTDKNPQLKDGRKDHLFKYFFKIRENIYLTLNFYYDYDQKNYIINHVHPVFSLKNLSEL